MNKDQIKGKTKEIAGEIQQQTGRIIGSEEQEAKGHAKEIEGKIQKKVGDVKEVVEDTTDEIKRDLKR